MQKCQTETQEASSSDHKDFADWIHATDHSVFATPALRPV